MGIFKNLYKATNLGGTKNETELKIELFNGSTLQIFGADHPDSFEVWGFMEL